MTAKPICVVYLPENIDVGGVRIGWNMCNDLTNQWSKEKPDYYWFVLMDFEAERIEFKVFYEKDFTETQYEELKQIINEKVNNDSNHDKL